MRAKNDDPFAGYDLPDADGGDKESGPAPTPARRAAGPPAQSTPRDSRPPQARARSPEAAWEPSAFEPRCGRGGRKCQDCLHYVTGGALAVDRVPELKWIKAGAGFKLVEECRVSERDFEVRELEQIVEKAKTLDTAFDEVPRIRDYCIAGSTGQIRAKIPEIKNHDGYCEDFFPGPRPAADCQGCAHRQAPITTQPGASASHGGEDELIRMAALGGTTLRTFHDTIDATRSIRQQNRQNLEGQQQEYEQKLRDDVQESILFQRSPNNGTLETCAAKTGDACAVVNRSHHCPLFSTDAKDTTNLAGGRRWYALMYNEAYRHTVDEVQAALNADLTEREGQADKSAARVPRAPRPPCFSCAHMRHPAKVDPFAQIHFKTEETMQLRAQYRNEQKKRGSDELRICAQPGKALGDHDVPSKYVWCAQHSERSSDGKVAEYAYCFRVLKQIAPDGDCPSYLSGETAHEELKSKKCPRCQRAGEVRERDGRLWCVWCSDWMG